MGKSIIGSSITIEGEVSGDDHLEVHGQIAGKIATAGAVDVLPSAVVEAEIDADRVRVEGRSVGKVQAKSQVEITEKGNVAGDIFAPKILIALGAQFKGHIDMG